MQEAEVGAENLYEEERCCLQCKEIKPRLAFAQQKGKADGCKKICRACEQSKQEERRRRVAIQRGIEQGQQEEREQRKRSERERRIALLQAYEERQQERERWYHEQPARRCRRCREILPATAFGGVSSIHGIILQALHIHSCCQRTFPVGQVIYAEIDPETNEICYVGRTGNPERRHAQHIDDVSPTIGQWGAEKKIWYTRSNWMYALAEKGLVPSMHILKSIDVSPLVIEWELRYIWHGIQQGWKLLNIETMDEKLVARVKASSLNFLEAPFETLVQQGFFSLHEFVAFIHKWYQS